MEQKKMNIVLFDMDGTLTEPREKISKETVMSLMRLSLHSTIGILTGSKMKDLVTQCEEIWKSKGAFWDGFLYLLPCNGTKCYKVTKEGISSAIYENDMRSHLGEKKLSKIFKRIQWAQSIIVNDMLFNNIIIEPDFLDYRGSLINWCPIGRAASNDTRSIFSNLDDRENVRNTMIELLTRNCDVFEGVTIAKGGVTSLDIFPNDWDKTYPIPFFDADLDYNRVWFVGDACEPGRNDYEIYKLLSLEGVFYENIGTSFKTCNIDQTNCIIDLIIRRINNCEF
jgi:phosphomannomutase